MAVEELTKDGASILATPVTMGLVHRHDDQLIAQMISQRPAHNAARAKVDNHSEVKPSVTLGNNLKP